MKYIIFILISFFFSCSGKETNSHVLKSVDYPELKDRVEVMSKEIKLFSKIEDAEFDLFNVNGFNSTSSRMEVPGASSSFYKFVVKVDIKNLDKWLVGFEKQAKVNDLVLVWVKDLVKHRANNWKLNSEYIVYKRVNDDVVMIVYPNKGFVFKYVENN